MNRSWLWIIVSVLVIALAAELGYYYLWPKKSNNTVTVTQTPAATPTTTPSVQANIITDPGVTWVEPVKLADLGLISTSSGWTETSYYKVADLSGGGQIILATSQPEGPTSPEILRFKKDSAGKYTYLVNNSAEKDFSVFSKILSSDVLGDYQSMYQSISAPSFLTVKDVTLKAGSNYGLFSEINKEAKEIATTDYGKLYRNGSSNIVNYVLKLADSSYATYVNKFPFQTDDEISLVTWTDGTVNKDKYTPEGYVGCGRTAANHIITDTANSTSRLVTAGKTNTGDTIYTVAATDDIMKAAYENYKIGRTKDILTIEKFAASRPVFIWQNGFGDYVVFTGRNFAGLAECGKPVIYLYPAKETAVTVKIGASIVKSEPTYKDGWQVVAEPSGSLLVDGKTYESLYWEGQGQIYPRVDKGFVVAKADLEATLKAHLAKLGLNEKESADFMAFWLPKMPKTAYTRLTWFGTGQVDQLAPLSVTPKPDTIIRIFLDFEGLNQKITLPTQSLTAIPRQGFTLIEWGGLLK